ncbi:MAG: transglycosylase SLT domain-containing protein [Dehalococcoidia bacterium]
MAIDPSAAGVPSAAHVSLHDARAARYGLSAAGPSSFRLPDSLPSPVRTSRPASAAARPVAGQSAARPGRQFEAHTPISSSTPSDPDRWDDLLNRTGRKFNVPPLFLKAVMLAESGGRPDAVGDSGHSVGLFQLHDAGYGAGMGDARYDPETNADRGAKGLAEAWHIGQDKGYSGEYAVRKAYDYSFNPGGGFAYQGDAVVKYYNELLAEQGQPPLA